MTRWGEASSSQAGEGSATGSQSGRQGLGDRHVVRQAGVWRQAGSQAGRDSVTSDGRRTREEGRGLSREREH